MADIEEIIDGTFGRKTQKKFDDANYKFNFGDAFFSELVSNINLAKKLIDGLTN